MVMASMSGPNVARVHAVASGDAKGVPSTVTVRVPSSATVTRTCGSSTGPVVSSSFGGLFAGKSVNTTGFILAILKHLGLVKPIKEKPRCYEAADPGDFMANLKALIDSSVDLNTDKPIPQSAASKKPVSKTEKKAL